MMVIANRSGQIHRLAHGTTLAVLIGTAGGCSLVVDGSTKQCSTTLDCQVRGLDFAEARCIDNLCQPDPTWSCVDGLEAPPAQTAVSAGIQVTNLLDQSGFADVHATLYASLDITLSTPVADAYTGEDGRAQLSVPAGFDGFVMLENVDLIEPVVFYPNLPVTAQTGLGQVFAARPGGSAGLINLIGEVPQAGRGLALMAVQDCNDTGGNGASFQFEGEVQGSTPFYAFNGVASSSARTLDTTGQGGIVNVRPGVIGVDLRWGDKTVSSASVLIRADTVTQFTMLPGRAARGVPLVR
ncbi:MAG TPA: hypothetical protein VMG12_37685 [Polyangiaceae bacterium]|nr:hypothetical protein [Polyangiaceae bacterium]